MASRFIFCALLGMLFLATGCGAPAPPVEEVRTFVPEAGAAAITYRYLQPSTSHDTGRQVLLLHRSGANTAQWEGFAQQLSALGYTVLAPDLPRSATPAELLAATRALWDAVGPGPNTPARHVVIGEVEGAILALELAASSEEIGATVLLSPAMKLPGFDALERMRAFDRCPVLLVAAENDAAASTTAMQLKDAAPAFCELALYPGTASGADLFAIRTAAMTQVTDWLELILGAKPAP